MSILQFIVDMKWAFFALVLLIFLTVAVWKMKPDTRAAFRTALMTRGLKLGLPGGINVDWSAASPSEEAVSLAAAPDGQLAEIATQAGSETAEDQVQEIRREAVEQVMREAAEWGWTMAQAGFQSPPFPQITWEDEKPQIGYGFSSAEQAHLKNVRGWLRPHAGSDSGRGSTGGRGGSAAPGGS